MGIFSWLLKGRGFDVSELARRLELDEDRLRRFQPAYRSFSIPKSSGGMRRILAPDPELKSLQRRILDRLLARLRIHPAAMAFEPGRSIVTNALAHCGQEVVVRMDLKDFFPNTSAERLRRYFRLIGWNRPAANLLVRLCTSDGGLPQGAPTSPRLSNLVNYRLDARIAGVAARCEAVYTRYADDITLSMAHYDRTKLHRLIRFVRRAVAEEGYAVHRRKKLSVRRRHHRQLVTGLVVNERVGLPRPIRRWLRAVQHRMSTAQPGGLDQYHALATPKHPTITPLQLQGWQALCAMIVRQAGRR